MGSATWVAYPIQPAYPHTSHWSNRHLSRLHHRMIHRSLNPLTLIDIFPSGTAICVPHIEQLCRGETLLHSQVLIVFSVPGPIFRYVAPVAVLINVWNQGHPDIPHQSYLPSWQMGWVSHHRSVISHTRALSYQSCLHSQVCEQVPFDTAFHHIPPLQDEKHLHLRYNPQQLLA